MRVVFVGPDHPAVRDLFIAVKAFLATLSGPRFACELLTLRVLDATKLQDLQALASGQSGDVAIYVRSAAVFLIPALSLECPHDAPHLWTLRAQDRQLCVLPQIEFERALREPFYILECLCERLGLAADATMLTRAKTLLDAWRDANAHYDHAMLFLEDVAPADVRTDPIVGASYPVCAWGSGHGALWDGWSIPQTWGAWTVGQHAIIGVPAPRSGVGRLALHLRCGIPEEIGVAFIVDGTDSLFTIAPAGDVFDVSIPLPGDGSDRQWHVVALQVRPRSEGQRSVLAADHRTHGIGLHGFALRQTSVESERPACFGPKPNLALSLAAGGAAIFSESLSDVVPDAEATEAGRLIAENNARCVLVLGGNARAVAEQLAAALRLCRHRALIVFHEPTAGSEPMTTAGPWTMDAPLLRLASAPEYLPIALRGAAARFDLVFFNRLPDGFLSDALVATLRDALSPRAILAGREERSDALRATLHAIRRIASTSEYRVIVRRRLWHACPQIFPFLVS